MASVVSERELALLDAYWRAANYLSVGQIYLRENPLLRTPLAPEHIKTRLLGHWGTSPGLSFIYAHLNRVIRKFDKDLRLPDFRAYAVEVPEPGSPSRRRRASWDVPAGRHETEPGPAELPRVRPRRDGVEPT
jgi:phosphoketolase